MFSFINTLFPNYCVNCTASLSGNGVVLCPLCFSNLDSVITKKHCNICCSLQIDDNPICNDCTSEKIGSLYYDKNISLYSYQGIIVELIREAKFSNRYSIWRLFIKKLSKIMLKEINSLEKYPIIIPVPISKKTYRKRTFNQSALLAKAVAKNNNIEYYENILIKNRDNRQQSILSFEDRVANPKDCYSIYNKKAIKNNTIVFLIDDVFTTGSTINECARVLKSAGVSKVFSFTIAR